MFGSTINYSVKGSLKNHPFLPFVKQKGSSDVEASLWNHLDKKVLLWHREAPFFLK